MKGSPSAVVETLRFYCELFVMTSSITAIDVPPSRRISRELQGADFFDSYEMPLAHGGRSALDIYLKIIAKTPSWVNFLMAIRNRIVAVLGLKNLGHLGSLNQTKETSAYRVGDRVGIFSLLSISDDEIILVDSDKHLDVKVSVCKLAREDRQSVAVTTVVHIHNLLGRIYMLFVAPVHRRIVPATLVRAADGQPDA
ncbi:MAG: hypothetical protein ACD_23C00190G0002 [uncultured bacterium]|nr:MAG: hypothetical protein ACD_23C00190G0002 [uncultured bacterium]